MPEEAIEGGAQLREVALRLQAAGQRDLLLAMRRNIRVATLPAKDAVRASAQATLPRTGGLNEWVASAKIGTRILTGPKTAGVTIRIAKRGHDMKDLDATGELRHPVFGNRKTWVSQTVQPGFATRPLTALSPAVGAACLLAMRETAALAGFH